MKIKIHNCLMMGNNCDFMLPHQIFIYFCFSQNTSSLGMMYENNDVNIFILFNLKTKKFRELPAFGKRSKKIERWWLNPVSQWKEIMR